MDNHKKVLFISALNVTPIINTVNPTVVLENIFDFTDLDTNSLVIIFAIGLILIWSLAVIVVPAYFMIEGIKVSN